MIVQHLSHKEFNVSTPVCMPCIPIHVIHLNYSWVNLIISQVYEQAEVGYGPLDK